MLPRRPALIFLLAAAGFVNAQTLADLPGCGQTCFANMVQQGKQLGCPDGAIPCLCTKSDFNNGIHDCAQKACAPDLFSTVTKYVSSLCAATPLVTASTASQTTLSSASTAAANSVPSISSSSSTASLATQTTSSVTSPSTSPASSITASSSITTGSASTPSASSTATSTAAVGSSTSSADAAASSAASPAPGLSSDAKIGVGVGAAAGGVALITLGACILVTRRQKMNQNRSHPLQISDPLPGSGRTYANDHRRQQYGVGMSELEMRSKRYEDMVPRQSPRTMV